MYLNGQLLINHIPTLTLVGDVTGKFWAKGLRSPVR